MKESTTYQKMLEDRFYLYRPWMPIAKSIEAEVIGGLELPGPVLDIGCGNGLFGKYCYKKKIDVGLDCDELALREAERKGVYKTLEAGDAEKLQFSDGSFGTVVSVCAIEHIPGLDKVLQNVRRVLKKGGRFIFTVPSRQFGYHLFKSRLLQAIGLGKKAALYAEEKNERSGHIHIYEPKKWEKLLREKSFAVDSIDYIFPKEAVLLWSFFHSLPFRIIFLPFRVFRDFNIGVVDNILRFVLDRLLTEWVSERSKTYKKDGGYLLIQALKN